MLSKKPINQRNISSVLSMMETINLRKPGSIMILHDTPVLYFNLQGHMMWKILLMLHL